MASFCKQCSEEIFGEDFEELANLGDPGQLSKGYGFTALCEECGMIVVDIDGRCMSFDCDKHGEENKRLSNEPAGGKVVGS